MAGTPETQSPGTGNQKLGGPEKTRLRREHGHKSRTSRSMVRGDYGQLHSGGPQASRQGGNGHDRTITPGRHETTKDTQGGPTDPL